jgi:LysM repeat protein
MKPLKTEAHEPLNYVTVVVKKGDSLWKIAEKYDNNKMDLRQYIYIIEKYNHLDNSVLQPGQRIILPVYE